MPHDSSDFAIRLVHQLEPVRQAFLAQVVLGLYESGVVGTLEANPLGTEELANGLGLRADRLSAVLAYARYEQLLEERDGRFRPSETLLGYRDFLPWFQLLIGGYSGTLADLPQRLKADDREYGARRLAWVGVGSAGISQHDTLPVVRSLAARLDTPLDLVIDAGCSDASYLVDLCQRQMAIRAIGVDGSAESCAIGSRRVAALGLQDRITLVNQAAQEFWAAAPPPADLYITAFLLQELLAQADRQYVVDILARIRDAGTPHMIVIEVDFSERDDRRASGLGRSYYNPYFLLHAMTEQQLLPRSEWLRIFGEAGWDVDAELRPETSVDPTEFEVGFLLTRR